MKFELRDILRIILIIILILFAIPYLTQKEHYGLFDYVDLPFHEAGHFVFGIFGLFIGILGGTLGQLTLPVGFLIYFGLIKKDHTGACFSVFWLGQNFINISVYMADAITQKLNLVGGDIHDWSYLCAELKWATKIDTYASFVHYLGILIMLAGIVLLTLITIQDIQKNK